MYVLTCCINMLVCLVCTRSQRGPLPLAVSPRTAEDWKTLSKGHSKHCSGDPPHSPMPATLEGQVVEGVIVELCQVRESGGVTIGKSPRRQYACPFPNAIPKFPARQLRQHAAGAGTIGRGTAGRDNERGPAREYSVVLILFGSDAAQLAAARCFRKPAPHDPVAVREPLCRQFCSRFPSRVPAYLV